METEEQIKQKTNTLENYFGWKARGWLKKNDRRRRLSSKTIPKLKCKICLIDVDSSFMNKHSELCMKKKQIYNELKTLQNNFHYYVTLSENVVRNQKTLYHIEK